ncbi:hypothetical protein F0562_010517 [Nyssa sinensis]|uniref:Zinc finger PHD-type domain-containing protein n=1 Tax=Nyssa sinensis TaxID=561372 RepID=A0A5J5A2P8_9ASTE|nr:hypothetical protein F0562_010517 [Nyssa sinensis]
MQQDHADDFVTSSPLPKEKGIAGSTTSLQSYCCHCHHYHHLLLASQEEGLGYLSQPQETKDVPDVNNASIQAAEKNRGKGDGNENEEEDNEDDGIECAVCQSTDGDPSDPIVFCDGCDLMVHATCYGNSLLKGIPEVTGGAMKHTNDSRWAHFVCTLFVPEVFFTDPEGKELIGLKFLQEGGNRVVTCATPQVGVPLIVLSPSTRWPSMSLVD